MQYQTFEPAADLTEEQMQKIKARFESQKQETQQVFIKRMLQGAKAIDLNLLDAIIAENDLLPYFSPTEFMNVPEKTGEALQALKEFCLKIRSIK